MSVQWNIETVSTLLLNAAKKAIEMQKDIQIKEKNTVISMDNEVYTNADVAIEEQLITHIANPSEYIYSIGEETVAEYMQTYSLKTILQHEVWVIDPIDGTSNFMNRLPNWGISIGYIKNNEFTEGAVILPELREMFVSDNKHAYYCKSDVCFSKVDTVTLVPFSRPTLLNQKYTVWTAAKSSYAREARTYKKFHMNRSCVYSIAKVLTGGYAGYMGKAKIWDFAGCIGLFRNIGLTVYYYDRDSGVFSSLPWSIDDNYWVNNYTTTAYDLIFTNSEEQGLSFIPR